MNDPHPKALWLLRHGNREDFVDLDWARTAARPHDPALSLDGVIQARRAGTRLRGEGIRHIFTSPYLRCAQTAAIVAEGCLVPVDVEPGLGELNHPDWSERQPSMLSRSELALRVGVVLGPHLPVLQPGYPESIEDAFARSLKTAHALIERYPGPLLLVGHALSLIGIVRGLTCHQGEVPCPAGGLIRVDLSRSEWALVMGGDTVECGDAVHADRL